MELERDSLKGFARLTKKGELQSRIDRKNEEIDLLKVGLSGKSSGMDSKRYMISIRFLQFLKQLMPIIGTRWINGKNNTEKKHKSRKKAYPNGYRIIKGKMLTDKRNKLQKAKVKGRGNRSFSITENL